MKAESVLVLILAYTAKKVLPLKNRASTVTKANICSPGWVFAMRMGRNLVFATSAG
jgi:hypothetical protein